MIIRKLWLSSVMLLVAVFSLRAQVSEPVRWKCTVLKGEGNEATLQWTATVEKGWHLYSQYNTLGITQQTVFEYQPSAAYQLVGKTSEPAYTEFTDEFGTDRYFEKSPVIFKQKIKILSEKDFKISASVDAQACIEGKCVMVGDEFEVAVKGVPQHVSDNAAEERPDEVDAGVSETGSETVEPDPAEPEAAVKADSWDKPEKADLEKDGKEKGISLWAVFAFALAAGMLSILTPCVFPMIPMTINFFMHNADGENGKQSGIQQAWMFGGSIIFIFAVLGAILTLLFGPDAMYTLSTHWIPNLIFFIIFFIFSLSFFGLFEITLPSWMINKSDAKADQGGWMAPFFIALTTVLVSFSCTGPILGGALVELSTSGTNRMIPLLSMLGFGIGFAAPFTLLAMFPKFLTKMKSGSWMNTVKVTFAFLELAFGLKFLSMADLYCGWHLLDREVYLALWIVIFGLLGFYLLGKLRFNGDSEVKQVSVLRLFLAILTFSFTIYMVPGMFGAPLNAISGFIPPMSTQDFDINGLVIEQGKLTVAQFQTQHADVQAVGALPADRKYVEELDVPPGFEAFFDLEEAKAYAKKVNKPIFIDFTGKTCANCRKMEQYVWSDPEVTRLLQQEFVICSLFADSKIKLPRKDWGQDAKGRDLKTLGQKNINYQQLHFNINAQPYYVLIDAEGQVLTHKNHQYDKNVKHFVDFLNEGLANFKKGASEK